MSRKKTGTMKKVQIASGRTVRIKFRFRQFNFRNKETKKHCSIYIAGRKDI